MRETNETMYSVIPVWRESVDVAMNHNRISREDLMIPLGVTTIGAIGNYFTGQRKLDINQAASLAKAVGISLDHMMADHNHKNEKQAEAPLNARQMELLDVFDVLTIKMQRTALKIIRALVDE